MLVLNDGLGREVADEVIGAVEVVETRHGREASPVIERVSTGSETPVDGNRLSSNTRDKGRGNGDLEKLGKHFE